MKQEFTDFIQKYAQYKVTYILLSILILGFLYLVFGKELSPEIKTKIKYILRAILK